MGADTKESIDRQIANKQGFIALLQAELANAKYPSQKESKRQAIAHAKAELAHLKARRKSCKN